MNFLVLFVLLVLNFAISWWNAWAVGRGWTEVKVVGGWARFITWCGAIMSACGFTWVYLTILTIIVVVFKFLSVEAAEAMFNLGYLLIILPIVGSGFGIWAYSLIVAYKRRSFGSMGVAGWNTFAQAHNVYTAAKHAPGAVESVLEFFTKGKSKKSSEALAVILLVIVALGSGVLTTAAIIRKADRDHAIEVEASWT